MNRRDNARNCSHTSVEEWNSNASAGAEWIKLIRKVFLSARSHRCTFVRRKIVASSQILALGGHVELNGQICQAKENIS